MIAAQAHLSPDVPVPPSRSLRKNWRFRHRGFFGAVLLGPALVLTALSTPMIREGTWLDSLMDFLAWICFIGGVFFRFWSTLYVGGRKRHSLMTEGPYSICRNPLYVGSFLLTLCAGVYLKSLTFTAFIALASFTYIFFTVPAEEKDLREIHGAAFDEYCRKTPRFLPRFALFYAGDSVEVKLHGLRLEAKRCALWMFLPVAGEALAHARVADWWPQLFHLL